MGIAFWQWVSNIKHPLLCPAIGAEPRATATLDCFNSTISDEVSLKYNDTSMNLVRINMTN